MNSGELALRSIPRENTPHPAPLFASCFLHQPAPVLEVAVPNGRVTETKYFESDQHTYTRFSILWGA